jgi:hypothetical protein
MAKGLYLTSDGQVLVEYDKRRRVPIPSAQYKANGYKPPCDKLPPEVPRKERKELAHAGLRAGSAPQIYLRAAIEAAVSPTPVGARHLRPKRQCT